MDTTWRERLVAWRQRGRPTEDDRLSALSWTTCAVAEQHAAMPDIVVYGLRCGCARSDECSHELSPLDRDLDMLGTEFYEAVRANALAKAESLLDRIEDRAAELKRGHEELRP